jgi:hypothetical protein
MDEQGFVSFMKKKRKTPNTIDACVENAKEFEAYLVLHGKSIDTAIVEDLESFAVDHIDKKRVSRFMWTLSYYFLFIDDSALLKAANQIRGSRIKTKRKSFKLKDFRGVKEEHTATLASIDIKDIEKMLEVGKTPKMRSELAEKTGLNIKVIEEFVKLSDLARIPGVKGIRARLYYDAGFDILEKLRSVTHDELLRITREFVEQTEFDGIAPLPKEAQGAIDTAKKLPNVAEW